MPFGEAALLGERREASRPGNRRLEARRHVHAALTALAFDSAREVLEGKGDVRRVVDDVDEVLHPRRLPAARLRLHYGAQLVCQLVRKRIDEVIARLEPLDANPVRGSDAVCGLRDVAVQRQVDENGVLLPRGPRRFGSAA